MKASALVLLAVVALAGCAHQAPSARSDAASAVATSEQQLAREATALEAATAGDRPLDCAHARTLRDNICQLAERICDLIARDPTIPDGPRRCEKAQTRCQAARQRVAGPCKT